MWKLNVLSCDFVLPVAPHQVTTVKIACDLDAILEFLHDSRRIIIFQGLSFVYGKVKNLLNPLAEVNIIIALSGFISILIFLALDFFF